MRVEHSLDVAKRQSVRMTMMGGLLAASVATNLLLGVAVSSLRQTILVPMLPAQVSLSNIGGVSADYLESFARDTVYLFLNRTPDNQGYFEQQLLKIADAGTYQAIRASLSDARRHTLSGHVSQAFIPSDWYVNAPKLYVEASGTLTTSNGTQAPDTVQKIYALQFVRRGASLRLATFQEISRDNSLGSRVPISAPPPPTTVPLEQKDGV